ncbi:MAG: tetratricopeptide repeat-containing glycosyltransferase family protein [Betaproteobacteria bacterium]
MRPEGPPAGPNPTAPAPGAESAELHCQRGNEASRLGRNAEALASYERAVALKPDFAEALYSRGAALQRLARFEDAVASYDAVLALLPHHPGTLNNRGAALQGLGRIDDALASYDLALAAQPEFVDALRNRAGALLEAERWEDALASYDRARALGAESAAILVGRGNALHELRRHREALACYDRALTLAPDDAEALNNRGAALQELQRYDDALASYARAIDLRPDYAEAHYNDGVCRLLLGDFDRGWREFEWRWKTPAVADYNPPFDRPLWLGGEDIAGRTLLLHPEFGLGDTLQFCRYAPLAAARGARVVLQVQRPLMALLSGMAGVDVIARGDPLPEHDFHCPLLSLPLAFDTRQDAIPAAVPYVVAAPALIRKWESRMGPRTRPRVGLVWSGNAKQPNDRNRSSRLAALRPLLGLPAQFVVLQTEMRAEDRAVLAAHPEITHYEGEFADFADTAALLSLMDLVITVDTSVAHLAGAMGRPAWIMLAHVPDWRWLLHRDDCPWYPTARLWRQPKAGEWASVVARIGRELPAFLRSAAAGA